MHPERELAIARPRLGKIDGKDDRAGVIFVIRRVETIIGVGTSFVAAQSGYGACMLREKGERLDLAPCHTIQHRLIYLSHPERLGYPERAAQKTSNAGKCVLSSHSGTGLLPILDVSSYRQLT